MAYRPASFWKFALLISIFFSVHAFAADPWAQFDVSHREFLEQLVPDDSDLDLTYTLEGNHHRKDVDGNSFDNFTMQTFDFDFETPIPVNKDQFFRFAFNYDARAYHFDTDTGTPYPLRSRTLQSIQPGLGFGEFISDDFMITGIVYPGVFSDFQTHLTSADLEFSGDIIAAYQVSPKFQLHGGAAATHAFGKLEVIPILGGTLQSDDKKWRLYVTAPIEARISRIIDPKSETEIFLDASLAGEEYNAHFSDTGKPVKVEYRDEHFGIGVTTRVTQLFRVTGEFGLVEGSAPKIDSQREFSYNSQYVNGLFMSIDIGFIL